MKCREACPVSNCPDSAVSSPVSRENRTGPDALPGQNRTEPDAKPDIEPDTEEAARRERIIKAIADSTRRVRRWRIAVSEGKGS